MIPKAKAWTVRVYWTEGNRKDTTVYEAYGPTKLFAWWNARPKVMKAYRTGRDYYGGGSAMR